MTENNLKVMEWWKIIAILVATGLVVGLLPGLIGLSSGVSAAGVGASVGAVGALLFARRRAAFQHKDS